MNKAQHKIFAGVNKLNNIVKITIGPNGRNVIIDRENGSPLITNDGITIAKQVIFKDAAERLGAEVIRQASLKTNEEAGDGTTSAIILATALVNHAKRALRLGNSAPAIKDALLSAASKALSYVSQYAKPVHKYHDLANVATNSCGNAADGALVAKALTKVGADGLVTLEMNKLGETKVIFTNGVKIPATNTSPYFTDKEFADARILVTTGPINSLKEILPLLENALRTKEPLLLMAKDFSPEVINALLLNRVKAGLPVMACRTLAAEDCALICNATLIAPQNDLTLERATPDHLGRAEKILFHQNDLVILSTERSPDFDAHITRLNEQVANTADDYQKTRLKERIANLTATAAVITVGCPTEAETMEKRLRLEDAVAATANAMRDGVVSGGGLTYVKIAAHLNKQDLGERLLKQSLPAITKQIQKNYRFDRSTCTAVDAATVIKSVIKNAVSAAAILITTGAIISNAT